MRPTLYDLDRPALEALFAGLGAPRYRADQVWRWLYARLEGDVAAMTDLPLALRERLAEAVRPSALHEVARTESADGMATKVLYRLHDGQAIETVLMHFVDPADQDGDEDADRAAADDVAGGASEAAIPAGRHTVCISTQAGCAMGCAFCATGQMGLVRDLTRGEVVEQVVRAARTLAEAGERLGNVVFMGMGEPLANWVATMGAIETLTDPHGLGMSARRITVSTVGIVPGIRRLADSGLPVRLAVSLHAPDDALRSRLVAVNAVYGLGDILAACRDYQAAGGRRITFEYVLIDGVNDRPEQADALAARLRGLRAHVNLIPLNPTEGSALRPSRPEAAAAFAGRLRRAGIPATLRQRRGIEIAAGCGQLRAREARGLVGRTIPLEAVAAR